MFDRILAFLKDLPSGAGPNKPPGAEDPRIAAAALMYHVMDADGVRQDAEWERMKAILSDSYGLSGEALDKLVTAGGEADEDAVDLYTFTSLLKRHLEPPQRVEFREADGTIRRGRWTIDDTGWDGESSYPIIVAELDDGTRIDGWNVQWREVKTA